MTEELNNWLDEELRNIETATAYDGEKLPAVKFEENKITTLKVDASAKWEKWHDEVNKTYKAIIPCNVNGVKHLWWLNVKNPIYKEIVRSARDGTLTFKILQTGKGQNTKYAIVQE